MGILDLFRRKSPAAETRSSGAGYTAQIIAARQQWIAGTSDLAEPYTFEDALAALIRFYAFEAESKAYRRAYRAERGGGELPPACKVEIFEDDGFSARIQLGPSGDHAVFYEFQPLVPAREAMERAKTPPPRHSLRWIDQRSILPIARAFAGEMEAAQ